MKSRRWLLIGAGILLALVAFAAGIHFSRQTGAPPAPSSLPSQAAISRLLALKLLDTGGQEKALAQWRGKPLIVNFWATWCPPCLKEMPAFSRLQEKHPQVQFIGIAIDTPQNVQAFAARQTSSYPLLLGSEEILSLLPELGNSRNALPFTVAIDANGDARQVRMGGISESETEALITRLQ